MDLIFLSFQLTLMVYRATLIESDNGGSSIKGQSPNVYPVFHVKGTSQCPGCKGPL